MNTFNGVAGMTCDANKWFNFDRSGKTRCDEAKNDVFDTLQDVDLDCDGVQGYVSALLPSLFY